MNAIEIEELTRIFKRRRAVDQLSLTVRQGELFALLGQNGAGKTTTIRMLCGLLRPSGGDARLMGHSVVREPEKVKRVISLSPQETAVAAKLTVRENLRLVAEIYGTGRCEAEQKAEKMLEVFGLTVRAKERAKTLSGGMQRKLSLAMALIPEPAILFLDEPTLGLDVRARRELWDVVRALKQHMTIVLTTHYLEEAEALADRIGIMGEGRLQALGTVDQIKQTAGAETLEDAFLQMTEAEERTGDNL